MLRSLVAILVVLLVGAAAAGTYWWLVVQPAQQAGPPGAGRGGPGGPVPVEAQPVRVGDAETTIDAVGTLVSNESVVLRPEVDVWKPGAHTGTFRGNNLAFVSARVALETYWADSALTEAIAAKSALLRAELERIAADHPDQDFVVRGRGLMFGLACDADRTLAGRISAEAFRRGLVIETSGAHDEVLKFLPALTISEEELGRGLAIVRESLDAVLAG